MQTMPFLESCPFRVPVPKLIMEDPNKDYIVRKERKTIRLWNKCIAQLERTFLVINSPVILHSHCLSIRIKWSDWFKGKVEHFQNTQGWLHYTNNLEGEVVCEACAQTWRVITARCTEIHSLPLILGLWFTVLAKLGGGGWNGYCSHGPSVTRQQGPWIRACIGRKSQTRALKWSESNKI